MEENYRKELLRTLKILQDVPTYYFHNKLMEEAGEVAAVLSGFMGSEKKVIKLVEEHGSLNEALMDELGDTLNVILIIAARYGIHPEDVVERARLKMQVKNDEYEDQSGK